MVYQFRFVHQRLVWGSGEQIRNWTYVSDIVEGTILAVEHIEDGTAINLGTMERTRAIDAAREILALCEVDAEIATDPSKPTGPYNRVSDYRLAMQLLGWQPKVKFSEGLERTIRWFFDSHDRDEVGRDFERQLTER